MEELSFIASLPFGFPNYFLVVRKKTKTKTKNFLETVRKLSKLLKYFL